MNNSSNQLSGTKNERKLSSLLERKKCLLSWRQISETEELLSVMMRMKKSRKLLKWKGLNLFR